MAYCVVCLLLFIVASYTLFKLFSWFLSPYFIDKNDELPILRPYQFVDPSITSHSSYSSFPTIHDSPSKAISLIFPAYNEEKRISACLEPTIKYLIQQETHSESKPFSWEIIVVNDGSQDKTCEVVKEYILKHSTDKIRLLSYRKNQGKGFAVQQGMLHARGCLILFADADGASEITHLKRLEDALLNKLNINNIWNSYNTCGIAIGSRKHLQHKAESERSFFRNILMWGFHFVVKLIGNIKDIKDTQCGFKLFTRKAVKKTFMLQRIRGWCFDPELIMLAQKQHIPICEVQIKWQEVDGSKIDLITASFAMLRELLIMRACYKLGIWYNELQA